MTEERCVEPGKIVKNRLEFCRVDIVAVEPFLFVAAAPVIEALSGKLRHRLGEFHVTLLLQREPRMNCSF